MANRQIHLQALGVPEHVSLVREVLNQCEVTHFALIGHSNGGRVSLQLASESGQDLSARLPRVGISLGHTA